jgi:hypothetical protein
MKIVSELNRYYILSSALLIILGMYSCTGTGKKKEVTLAEGDEYYEFKELTLKDYGIPAVLMLPDETANIGASTKPEIIHEEGDFIWDILVGPNFELHIEDYGDYTDLVDYKKKELKDQDVFKINYLINKKDIIVYERTLIVRGSKQASPSVGVKHKSYHVYAQKIINGITYELRSRDDGYERIIIDLMAKSIQSFKPIQKKKNPLNS